MCSVRTITAPEAADLIVDGAVVTVSSSSGMGCPDAVLAAIGERFQRAGHPQNITSIHPIAAGDMWRKRHRSSGATGLTGKSDRWLLPLRSIINGTSVNLANDQ